MKKEWRVIVSVIDDGKTDTGEIEFMTYEAIMKIFDDLDLPAGITAEVLECDVVEGEKPKE